MTRTERLLEIIEILRRSKFAVTANELSKRFEISIRSVYRDISILQSQGVPIEGGTGVGYILRKGYTLPPLMFTIDEIEALILGIKWVSVSTDENLSMASKNALMKISTIIPEALRNKYTTTSILINNRYKPVIDNQLITIIRTAIKENWKMQIQYTNHQAIQSTRTIWPIAIGFFENAQIIAGWCEKRSAFRHFRTDRIIKCVLIKEKYPISQKMLFAKWKESEKIILDDIEI